MKYISFTVPCYNSQGYMKKCIDSLLPAGEDVEIIIVNDGSSDNTLQIANAYAREYPHIVRVIDKPNGGHGSGVNVGIQAAQGLYFKVVDSDDWLDTDALKILLNTIKSHISAGQSPDLYITNFVYDKYFENTSHVSGYTNKMPAGEFIGWDKIKKFRLSHMMLMHALVYKREALVNSGMVLPEHTFYVDNIFAYEPLPHTRTLYYLDVDLYHYFIGRADQSVNYCNFVKRYRQQIRVMLHMADAYTLAEIKRLPKGLKRYMWHSLQTIMMTTIFFTCAEYSEERRRALKEMWRHIKRRDKRLYGKLRLFSYATSVNFLGWRLRGKVMTKGYRFLCRRVKLG